MWTEKHRPKDFREMVGNAEARAKLSAWLSKWKPGSKAALLVGPPGTGKTTSVHILAASNGLNLVELNASDNRTKTNLSKKLGQVLGNTTLAGERTLIFLDEVDGLSGRGDFGAVDYIKESVKESANPLVMAANDPDSDQVRKLSGASTVIRFAPVPPESMTPFLEALADAEGLEVGAEKLGEISKASNGDLRYAVNALQSGAGGWKDLESTAGEALTAFFAADGDEAGLSALRSYPGRPNDKLREVYACVLAARLPAERRAAALDVLSRLDVILGQMLRGKDWRLLRYIDPILTRELRPLLRGSAVKYTRDSVPWMLQLRIWNDSRRLKDLASASGRRLHISQKGALVEDVPYMLVMASSGGFREALVSSLSLDEGYSSFLEKEAARSAKARPS